MCVDAGAKKADQNIYRQGIRRQEPTALRNKPFSSPSKPKLTIRRCEKSAKDCPVALQSGRCTSWLAFSAAL
jgi:hypothetical protein